MIHAVYRQLRDRLSNIGESTSSFNLVARLAEFVCLLDLLVSVEEYKLDGKKPWITFQDEFISQAEAAGMTETITDINDWMTHRRNRDTLSKLLGKRYIKS